MAVDLGQLGLDAPPPVGAPGPHPDLGDDICKPCPPHSARRHRPGPPMEEPRRRDAQEPARPLQAVPLSPQGLHDRVQVFWAHHPILAEQLRRPLDRGQFGLELFDPAPGLLQLSALAARRARHQAPVDAVLALPAIQRRLGHLQLTGQPGHRPASPDLVQHHSPELRRIRKRHPRTSQLGTPPLSQTKTKKIVDTSPGPNSRGHATGATAGGWQWR